MPEMVLAPFLVVERLNAIAEVTGLAVVVEIYRVTIHRATKVVAVSIIIAAELVAIDI